MEVLRLYSLYFEEEALFNRMETSEIEEYKQEIKDAVEANDGESKRLEAEAAIAEENKRIAGIAASYNQAVIAAASQGGGYRNSSFPKCPQPHRFQGIPQPQTSAAINAVNARLAAPRPAETGE